MAQFVGSFTYAGLSNNALTITNTTSFRSLFYTVAPDWDRGIFAPFPTPFGNITQTYDLPMTWRSKLCAAVALSCSVFTACRTQQPTLVPGDLVGSYRYRTNTLGSQKGSAHEWDDLTLRSDGTYKLVEGGPTKAKSEESGVWTFLDADSDEKEGFALWPGIAASISLGDRGYAVQVTKNEIKLIIDVDLTDCYVKQR